MKRKLMIAIFGTGLLGAIVGSGIGVATTLLYFSQNTPLSTNQSLEENQKDGSTFKSKQLPTVEKFVGKGPFGFQMGSSAAEYPKCKVSDNDPSFFLCSDAPKPYGPIKTYAIVSTNETGVCRVRGITKTIDNDGLGVQIRSEVNSFADDLVVQYGKWTVKSDNAAGIWDDAKYWMMGLLQGNRIYAYQWRFESPVNGVENIALLANASSSNSGYTIVEFSFANQSTCEEIIKNKRASALK